MTQRKPTVRELAEAVVAQADAKPGHVYEKSDNPGESCVYVKRDSRGRRIGDSCGCIVGEAFLSLGVLIPRRREGDSVLSVADEFTKYDINSHEDRFLMYGLTDAQRRQDEGKTWDDAVGMLRKRLALLAEEVW